MSTELDTRHEKVIEIAMLLAQKDGYGVEAWRLFEREAEATLTRISKPHSQNPKHDLAAR